MSSTRLQEAIAIFKSGHKDQARALLQQVLQQEPQQELAWLYLAACLDVPGQVRYCLEQALAINPANQRTRLALARYDRVPAQPLEPAEPLAARLLRQARVVEAEGHFEQAFFIYDRLLGEDPACVPAWLGKGLAAGMLSTPEALRASEAMQCFRTALQVSQPAAAASLADVQAQIADHQRRIAAHLNSLSRGLAVSPDQAARLAEAALFLLGQAYALEQSAESRSQALDALRAQLQRCLEYQQRRWDSRGIDVRTRQDLRDRVVDSVISGLPDDLVTQPAIQAVLQRFFHPALQDGAPAGDAKAVTRRRAPSSAWRIARYVSLRLAVLAVTLFIGVYAAVVVANLGGFVDDIIRARIDEAVGAMEMGGAFKDIPEEQRAQYVQDLTRQMEEAAGLYQPFWLRCLRWTVKHLRLQFDAPQVLRALPNSLLLFGTANLLLFFSGLGLALYLSHHYGSWLDRLVVLLSPVSSVPSWVYGAVLIVVFTNLLRLFPATGMLDVGAILAEPSWDARLTYIAVVARHLVLPVLAIFLSLFFQVVYSWRTFFLIHSGDDHVEVAKAKGLTARVIERRYILRPTLPYIMTNLALIAIGFWQTSLALEYIFYWPGIGKLYIDSVGLIGYRTPVVMGVVTIFAYLLVLTVFVLDILYLLVDPRLRLGENGQSARQQTARAGWRSLRRLLGGLFRFRAAEPSPLAPRRPARSLSPVSQVQVDPAQRRRQRRQAAWQAARQVLRYPSALVGASLILILVGVSIYVVIAIPYQQAVDRWVRDNHLDKPETVPPAWVNWFRREKLPETITLDSRELPQVKTFKAITEEMNDVILSYKFDYPYSGGFPQEIMITFAPQYREKRPYIEMDWFTPDGRQVELGSYSLTKGVVYRAAQDERLQRLYGEYNPHIGLFADPLAALEGQPPRPLVGQYELRISAVTFEPGSDLDAEVRVYGQVYGWAGTDHRRRDLSLALLWGAPVALGLGLLGALCSSLVAMLLAAIGVWFGGWVDGVIQALTEVNAALPVLPLAIMAYFLFGKNVWLTLGIVILFSIFGTAIKNYRAAFLQVRQLPYIESAQAYGAGSWRMIFYYLVPRIVPVLVPQLVAMVPGYVFLEATLSILRVSDPYLPTWGKMLYDALTNGALREYYYWALEPLALLTLTGIAFALVGFALDRIFNPRLRNL